ncbi:hypothetical protein RhiirA1_402573 [Rhizophagus irregularis]|uniref:Uncharacterized protein n=1 Tax=Rhizophagus irregularis TaxID=588596 RepID=A0A2N0QXQ7_9GLOM|nr:hypothetical protein RhiirA1_402573 [Rhizophagus irregularis]
MDFSRWVKVREYNCLKRKSTKKTKNPFLDNLPEYDISGSYFSLPGRGILVIVLSFVYLDAWKFGRKKKWELLISVFFSFLNGLLFRSGCVGFRENKKCLRN